LIVDYRLNRIKERLEVAEHWLGKATTASYIQNYQNSDEDERGKVVAEVNELTQPFVDAAVGIALASNKPLYRLPEAGEVRGNIRLGSVMLGSLPVSNFGISPDDLTKGVSNFAPSGTGKTNTVMTLLLGLCENKIPFVVFDFKEDYRHLIQLRPEIQVLKASWLRCNILQPPPGVGLDEWIMTVADFIPYSFGFYQWGTGQYFMSLLLEIAARKKSQATLYDLQERLKDEKMTSNRKAEWHDVLTSRIDSTLAAIGPVVATPNGYPIHELLDKPLVLELVNLRDAEVKLIISWWMSYVLAYRRANNHRGRLYHVDVFDEYHRLGSRQHEWSEMSKEMGDSIIERWVRESRDFGEGSVFAFQEISRIQHSVIENTELKICGNLSSWEDIDVAAGSMNLKENEVEALDKLAVGEFLVKRRGGTPFVLKVDLVDVVKNVNDSQLTERMKPLLDEMKSREPKEIDNVYLPEINDTELVMLQAVAKKP